MKLSTFYNCVDVNNFIVAGIAIILWFCTTLQKPDPLYVPPDDDLSNYPKAKHNTIDMKWVVFIVFAVQGVLALVLYFCAKKFPKYFNEFNFFTVMWTEIMIVCTSNIIINIFKSYVGRARPDMYAYCGYNSTYETCTGIKDSKRRGEFKSWPSGHSACAMSGSLFICLFLQKVVRTRLVYWSFVCSCVVLFAVFVGASRIRDFRHHTDDVLAGLFIGALVCKLIWDRSYKVIFKPDMYDQCCGHYNAEKDLPI